MTGIRKRSLCRKSREMCLADFAESLSARNVGARADVWRRMSCPGDRCLTGRANHVHLVLMLGMIP